MPWQECSVMNSRYEFLSLVTQPGSNFSQLCKRFGISRKTGYKWLKRFAQTNSMELGDHSRRPRCSPDRTAANIEAQVLSIRDTYNWGARKVAHCMGRDHQVPIAKSTVHSILQRYGRVSLPTVSGLDACRELSQTHPAIKVIVFSASGDPEVEYQARAAGAAAFVSKLSSLDLTAAIKRLCADPG